MSPTYLEHFWAISENRFLTIVLHFARVTFQFLAQGLQARKVSADIWEVSWRTFQNAPGPRAVLAAVAEKPLKRTYYFWRRSSLLCYCDHKPMITSPWVLWTLFWSCLCQWKLYFSDCCYLGLREHSWGKVFISQYADWLSTMLVWQVLSFYLVT